MSDYIDSSYYKELQEADPSTLTRNNRCQYDPAKGYYKLSVWGDTYRIYPKADNGRLECGELNSSPVHEYFDLFIIYYLLKVKDGSPDGELISEKDIPGGSTFFRGPHLIPTNYISDSFGNDQGAFKAACIKYGGTEMEMGDSSFRFFVTPDIPVTVVYWLGDEDFPAEAKLLFDKSIVNLLSLDIVFALAVGVCNRLGSRGERGD